MADRKIIAVVGATGAQGGGLARAILDDPEGGVAVRALTRKADSAAARALAERGAEVVEADLDDVDSLVKAFEGAHGAFCVRLWARRSSTRPCRRGFGFPGADDLGNMFQYKADFEAEYCGARPLDRTRELNPALQTYEEWLKQNANRIPLD